MPRYQHPNPLDLLFFAADQAMHRAGLPGAHVHLHLELGGRVDVAGLRCAVAGLYRLYPTIGARLAWRWHLGLPRWALDDLHDPRLAVVEHDVASDPGALDRAVATLFATPIQLVHEPPLQFHVFRGPQRDLVVTRWPHAVLDARGAFTLIETLSELYTHPQDPGSLSSAGDEAHDELRTQLQGQTWREWLRMVRPQSQGRTWAERLGALLQRGSACRGAGVVQLARGSADRKPGPMQVVLRHLSPAETAQVAAQAQQHAGAWPAANYVRACALHALAAVMGPQPAGARFSTNALIDMRRKRSRATCWNLAAPLSMCVPVSLAADVAAMTQRLNQETIALVRARAALRMFTRFDLYTRAPTAFVAAFLHRRLVLASRGGRLGLAATPSLRMDFMTPLSTPLATFCGAPLLNYYGYATLMPTPGFALHVNLTHTQLNISAVCFPSRVPRAQLERLLDVCCATLLDPSG